MKKKQEIIKPEEASRTSLSDKLSENKEKISFKILPTQADGDCAFHAILGTWDPLQKNVICPDVINPRKKVAAAIISDQSLRPLAIVGIQALMMSGRSIGPCSKQLNDHYHQFLDKQNQEAPAIWNQFAAEMQKYPDILQYINHVSSAKKNELSSNHDASFRNQFYTALNHNNGELYILILSEQKLADAFQNYNQRYNISFDWDLAISRGILTEYAHFISKPGTWLLVSELEIIARVFRFTVNYRTSPAANLIFINPGQAKSVSVCFNGRDHYEQVEMPEEIASLGSEQEERTAELKNLNSNINFKEDNKNQENSASNLILESIEIKRELPTEKESVELKIALPEEKKESVAMTVLKVKQEKEYFLSMVQDMLKGQLILFDNNLEKAWKNLCNHCGDHYSIEEWTLLFVELHELCQPILIHPVYPRLPPEEDKNEHARLKRKFLKALPSVKPMQWQIISSDDQATAKQQIQLWRQQVSDKSDETILCRLLYYQSAKDLHFYYYQSGQKPAEILFSQLQMSAESQLDFLVENFLLLPQIKAQLEDHPTLTLPILRRLFYRLHQEGVWAPLTKVTAEQPYRIVSQQRASHTVYYAQWFISPGQSAVAPPLPGLWTPVYPLGEPQPLEIHDSQGWLPLHQDVHSSLLNEVQRIVEHQQRFHRYTQCAELYPQWQTCVQKSLPILIQMTWHFTLAQVAAQHKHWGSSQKELKFATDAIHHGCKALALSKRLDAASDYQSKINAYLDRWVQAYIRQLLTPLLPFYQQSLTATFGPLERCVGKTQWRDFKTAHDKTLKILPFLFWLNANVAQKIYARFNQAVMDRQNDVISQVQDLAKNPSPEIDLKIWQDLLTQLLKQWQENGYLELASSWHHALLKRVTSIKLPEMMSPVERILADLQQGLCQILKMEEVLTVPKEWTTAHQAILKLLAQYSAYHQMSAYSQAKNRFDVRLRSYQLFFEHLAAQHSGYVVLAEWCQQRSLELQKLDLQSLNPYCSFEFPYAWQTLYNTIEKQNAAKLLEALATQLRAWLPEPPLAFEILALQAVDQPADFRLHLLVAESKPVKHSYLLAYSELLQLYRSLLPGEAAFHLEIQTHSPIDLGSFYCPLGLSHAESDSASLNFPMSQPKRYLPIFHQRVSAATSQFEPAETLLMSLVTRLCQNLSQVASHTQAAESVIRDQHHTQHSQALIEEGSPDDKDLTDPIIMLKRRAQAHQKIHALWQRQRRQVTPAVDLLVGILRMTPEAIAAFFQQAAAGEEKIAVNPAESIFSSSPKEEKNKFGKGKEPSRPFDKKQSKTEVVDKKSHPDDLTLRLYRRVPRFMKDIYIQQLEKQGENEKTIKKLYCEADATGWSYQQLSIAEHWQKTLRSLYTEDGASSSSLVKSASIPEGKAKEIYSSVTISLVEHGTVIHKQLRPEIAKQLLKQNGEWRSKPKGISSNHQVLRVVIPAIPGQSEQAVWFKLKPEQPGSEYLVQQIDQRLGCFATPAQQLVKIQVGEHRPLPVLISQEVAPPIANPKESQNMANILKYDPECINQISSLSFVSTLLRVLVINPEDDKSNDYFLLPDPDQPGYYRLIRIDNERAFFSPEEIHTGWRQSHELNVKTIIFCLDQMITSWEGLTEKDQRLEGYRQRILQLVPAECFQDILRGASDLHDQWCLLFSCEEASHIYETGISKQEVVFPVMLTPPDCEKALLERLYLIQQAWHHGGVSGLSLLDSVQANLGEYYRHLFEIKSNPSKRFAAGPGKWYQLDDKGQLQSNVSGMMALSRQLNLGGILKSNSESKQRQEYSADFIKRVWCRLQFSATQAFYGVGVWQHEKVLQIENTLLMTSGLSGLYESHSKEIKVGQAAVVPMLQGQPIPGSAPLSEKLVELRQRALQQFKCLPIADRTLIWKHISQKFTAHPSKNAKSKQEIAQFLLTILTEVPLGYLDLKAFQQFLTDKILITILKCAGRQLLRLDISGSLLITPAILSEMTTYCTNIRYFTAQSMTWKEATIENWLQVKRLDLSGSQLVTLWLNQLPQLTQLKLDYCKSLLRLSDSSQKFPIFSGIFKPVKDKSRLSKLQRLDIKKCRNLTTLQLEIELTNLDLANLMEVRWVCKPQSLVNWLQFVYIQLHSSDSVLFAKINHALTIGILDISNHPLNIEEWGCLIYLIYWDIFFIQLIGAIFPRNPQPILQHASFEEVKLDSMKAVLLGDSGIGKTVLIFRYLKEIFFDDYNPTVEDNYRLSFLTNSTKYYSFSFIDTGGAEAFSVITDSWIPESNLFLLCFSFTSSNSFEQLLIYFKKIYEVKKYSIGDPIMLMIGLKTDMIDEREISQKDAKDFADLHYMPYFECSSKTGEGVKELFSFIGFIGYQMSRNKNFNGKDTYFLKNIFSTDCVESELMRSFESMRSFKNSCFQLILYKLSKLRRLITDDKPQTEISKKLLTFIYEERKEESEIKIEDSKTECELSPRDKPDDQKLMLDKISLPEAKIESRADEPSAEISERKLIFESQISASPQANKISASINVEPLFSDPALLFELITPMTQINLQDENDLTNARQQLPRIMSQLGYSSWSSQYAESGEEKNPQALQSILKHLCLDLQYKYLSCRKWDSSPDSKSVLSNSQIYIQAHLALQQYHDLFQQTLELGIKASLLGITGRLMMTDAKDMVLGSIEGFARAIPGIGALLGVPVAGLRIYNQIGEMRRRDEKISQLFKSARDVEEQVAQLAERMTLSIRKELLKDKPSDKRLEAKKQAGFRKYYERLTTALEQQAIEWVTWQSFTPAQKLARVDAGYLLEQLPSLVTSKIYRGSHAGVATYLKILMHDPHFCYEELPEQKSEYIAAPSIVSPAAKYRIYAAKHQACLIKLKTQAEQPLTPMHWEILQGTLAELEVSLLELEPLQFRQEEADKSLSLLLTDWFDTLSSSSFATLSAPAGKMCLFQAPMKKNNPPKLAVKEAPLKEADEELIEGRPATRTIESNSRRPA